MPIFRGYDTIEKEKPAAAAGTVTVYHAVANPFFVHGYEWFYETAEANVDNTFDFAVEYTTDGSAFTVIKANDNPNGLLNTAAPLVNLDRRADAASSGAAAAAAENFAPIRVPGNAVIRFQLITAGTGTIPLIHLAIYGVMVGQ